jgi:hypothetical protein
MNMNVELCGRLAAFHLNLAIYVLLPEGECYFT